ncbi:hypothetical protein HMPREF9120_00519 [Neisseria sp. oral taxon 020 str. F0370]|nr:hypothetical protein HMPREF9120_00519 [Neisseria sp. oral taxon 020 str. F0370]
MQVKTGFAAIHAACGNAGAQADAVGIALFFKKLQLGVEQVAVFKNVKGEIGFVVLAVPSIGQDQGCACQIIFVCKGDWVALGIQAGGAPIEIVAAVRSGFSPHSILKSQPL